LKRVGWQQPFHSERKAKVCKDEIQKWDNWKELGGEDWDYSMPEDHMDDWT